MNFPLAARLRGRQLWPAPLLIGIVVALGPVIGIDVYWQRQLILIAVFTLIASGLNLCFGFGGELALGQVAFFAAGAYATAILYSHGLTDLLLAIVVSAAAAVVIGLITGIPGLRLSSWSLAVTSYFLVILVGPLVKLAPDQTGGAVGVLGILGPTFLGQELSEFQFYSVSVLLTLAWLFVLRNLVASRFGLALGNLRQSRQLVASLGMSTFRLRLSAYAVGAAPAGIAGALYAYLVGLVSPDSFDNVLFTSIIAATVIGGANSVWGSIVGAALVVLGPVQATAFQDYSLVIYGAFLTIVAAFFPAGIAGGIRTLWDRLLRRRPPVDDSPPVSGVAAGTGDVSGEGDLVIPGESLSVAGIRKRFSGVTALDGVDLTVPQGRVTAIIGANGAGKTTLLNVISGFVRADEGETRVGTTRLTGRTPVEVSRAGISRTFQTPMIPEEMTVLDVVRSGRLGRDQPSLLANILRLPAFRRARDADDRAAREALAFAGLIELADLSADSLPLGTRRLLEVVRCVAGQARVLLLDEPAAGLDERGLVELKQLMQRARDAGATVVLVEHNVPFVMEVADHIHVMDLGRVIASGPPEEIRRNSLVLERYLGQRHAGTDGATAVVEQRTPAVRERPGVPVLEVGELTAGYGDLTVIRGVSFSIHPGEIVALLGRNGAGKTTLLSGLAGLLPSAKGEIRLDGQNIAGVSAHRRAGHGLAFVQEGKRVFRKLTVEQNLNMGMRALALKGAERREALVEMYDEFPILKEKARQTAGELSGGQQQMLAIATALLAKPKVLLVDEPSSGLAPVIVEQVLEIVHRLKDRGVAVLLVEQLVDEVLSGYAEHVIVLDQGRISLESRPEAIDRARLSELLYTA
jgi:branched-chain amino acid transport system permease protein